MATEVRDHEGKRWKIFKYWLLLKWCWTTKITTKNTTITHHCSTITLILTWIISLPISPFLTLRTLWQCITMDIYWLPTKITFHIRVIVSAQRGGKETMSIIKCSSAVLEPFSWTRNTIRGLDYCMTYNNLQAKYFEIDCLFFLKLSLFWNNLNILEL